MWFLLSGSFSDELPALLECILYFCKHSERNYPTEAKAVIEALPF